jgi:hypothetical protein
MWVHDSDGAWEYVQLVTATSTVCVHVSNEACECVQIVETDGLGLRV